MPSAPEPSAEPARPAPSPALRVSDVEREATADRLRQASVEGRLDPEELDERLEQAYRARSDPDLARLLIDLPPPPRPVPSRRSRWRGALASYVGFNVWMVGIWAATDLHGYFWPVWTLVPGAAAVVAALARGRPDSGPLGRQAGRHDRRRAARDARREDRGGRRPGLRR